VKTIKKRVMECQQNVERKNIEIKKVASRKTTLLYAYERKYAQTMTKVLHTAPSFTLHPSFN